ncbi:MAG: threonine/serine dehydratase [Rhodobacteraceae bacterium]|nr:threonine/serine dehydratase [Paracoccaceae bacterium]
MSSIEMIRAAEQRLQPVVRKTPMLNSPFLDEIAGRQVLVKAECLQHTGSFKFRGGYSALSGLPDIKGVIAYSSGNHAQGVALAAQMHGVEAVIIMPGDAPVSKIENTKALGAKVVLYNRATEDRDALGAELADQSNLTLVKPFDEPLVIAGQGTTGLEIATQAAEFSVAEAQVLVPCGGGGLASGISLALAAEAPAMLVRPVEPAEFDDAARSLALGERVSNTRLSGSICDAIITQSPGEITFPIMQKHCGSGLVVSEDECLKTMALAFSYLKIIIEPGGAVALAAALFHSDEIEGDTVICVATGGNVDADMFARALAKHP